MGKTIIVKKISESEDDWEFEVTIDDEDGETIHKATLERGYYEGLTGGDILPEDFIKMCFKFLLKKDCMMQDIKVVQPAR